MSSAIKNMSLAEASNIIERMGQAGQPPERGISKINVGNEQILEIIEKEYLDKLIEQARGSAFKLVQGSYGSGKTHFLYCVRDIAWSKGLLTAYIPLSPQECPYEDSLKVYQRVANEISQAPEGDSLPLRSFPEILRVFAETQIDEKGKEGFLDWIRTTALKIAVDDRVYMRTCAEFLRAVVSDDERKIALLESWLLGNETGKQERNNYGIFSEISKNNAFQSLRSMVQVLTGYAFPGVVLLFDEVDRVASTSRKKLTAIVDNLRQVVDLCGSSRFSGLMFFYAVPPEFMTNCVDNYPALKQRLQSPLNMCRRSPQSSIIDLAHLDISNVELLKKIGDNIYEVFKVAYAWEANDALQQSNLDFIAKYTDTQMLDVGHRREFVKGWIAWLNLQYADGERTLDDNSIEEIFPQAGAQSFDSFEYEDDDADISMEADTKNDGFEEGLAELQDF